MEQVLANYTASISELKRNPSALIAHAGDSIVAILNHNKPTAYLIPASTYEAFLEVVDEMALAKIIEERAGEKSRAKEVSLDDL